MTTNYVEYEANNSGGSWWLDDEDWQALEDDGWLVAWQEKSYVYNEEGGYKRDENGIPLLEDKPDKWAEEDEEGDYRWLGALAQRAYKPNSTLEEAVKSWESVTKACATDAGCPCCGLPHDFTEYTREGKEVASGPHADYSASF